MKIEEPPLRDQRLIKISQTVGKSIKLYLAIRKKSSKCFLQFVEYTALNRSLFINIGLLLVLTLIPWISETSVNNQVYADVIKYSGAVDPVKAGDFSASIQEFIPAVEANKEEIALAIMQDSDNFTLTQQLSLNTGKEIEGVPERTEATYTVENGETITQIAEKFDLHVATILDANDIAPTDTKRIKEGAVLSIPSTDTSTSNDWLVALNKAEEEEKAKAAAAAAAKAAEKKKLALVKSATSTKTASGYSGVDTGDIATPINHNGVSRGYSSGHRGIDYRANVGTPVFAAANGRITKISTGWSGGYGNQIVVDHGNGRATRYAHLSQISVSVGQNVSRGQVIGLSGNTGRSTGPHLHFELIINGTPVPYR